jgi:hypothetical protein
MAFGVAAYGVYAAIERQFFLKMFWRIDFAFYDYEEPAVLFFASYISIMGAIACAAYYGNKILTRWSQHSAADRRPPRRDNC